MAVINNTEKTVLGILLDNPSRIDEAGLIPEHFTSGQARKIYSTLAELKNLGKPCDPVSVAFELEEQGVTHITTLDVADYVLKLSEKSVPSQTLGHYCSILVQSYVSRKAKAVGAELAGGKLSIEEATKALQEIDQGSGNPSYLDEEVQKEREQIREDIKQRAAGNNVVLGLGIGLGLDRVCPSGLPISCVGVLAGDTKSGKTTVAQNIAYNVASNGYGVIVFNVEDGEEIFRQKTLSNISGVPLEKIITRNLSEKDIYRLKAVEPLVIDSLSRVIVDSAPGPTAIDIIRQARKLKRLVDCKLVIVDYLQILARTGIEREALREAMLAFQHAAKADSMHYLVVSQLNRGHLKDREDPRPRRQDLYGSGSIEQFSKLIIGVHRPATFGAPVEGRHYEEFEDIPTPEVWAKRLELWVIGNNKGEDNVYVNAAWDRPTGRIEEE